MRKQKKNLSFKTKRSLIKRLIGIKRWTYKSKIPLRLNIRKHTVALFKSVNCNKEALRIFSLRIKVVKNNIFCYLFNGKTNALLLSGTAGLYNIKLSKKSMRFYAKNVLNKFFYSCQTLLKKEKDSFLFFTVHSSSRLKKNLIKAVRLFFKKRFIVIAAFNEVKCYNGCRQRKQIRRKRRFFRIFKNIT